MKKETPGEEIISHWILSSFKLEDLSGTYIRKVCMARKPYVLNF